MKNPFLPRFFTRLSTWQALLLLFCLILLFSLYIFPQRTMHLRVECSGASPVFDARFSYSPAEVYPAFAQCSPAGRRLYALSEASIDLVFPILYNLFLVGLLAAAYRRIRGAPGKYLPWLPLGSLLLDYTENACLITMLLLYPRQIPSLSLAASISTPLKWFWGLGCLVLAIAGFVVDRVVIKAKVRS